MIMIKIIKIKDLESVEYVLKDYMEKNDNIAGLLQENMNVLSQRNDIPDEEKLEICKSLGSGLEFFNMMELGYINGMDKYFLSHEIFEEYSTSLEGLVKKIPGAVYKNRPKFGLVAKPVFFTVFNHSLGREEKTIMESMSNDLSVPERMKVLILQGKGMNEIMRSLTDEEIEKFQNIYKAAIN